MGLYVAVVSDNDGSAFITKAEFDSLKNNFQAQIDNYNQSIDSKIDGAIASYLSGIKVDSDEKKQYRVFGADVGSWGSPARAAKKFSVMEIGNGTWNGTRDVEGVIEVPDLSKVSNRLFLYSKTKTNIGGYGEGWWMYGIYYNGVVTLGDSTSGFIASYYMNSKPWNPSKTAYGAFLFSIGTSKETPAAGYVSGRYVNEVYNKQLSDAFESPIPIINPKFPLYEIVSGSGNFRVFCGMVKRDGTTNTPSFWDGTLDPWSTYGMSPAVLLRVQHKNGTMEPAKINLTTAEESRWLVGDFEVNRGDKIILDITGYPGGGESGSRSSFWFTKDVSGWDILTS